MKPAKKYVQFHFKSLRVQVRTIALMMRLKSTGNISEQMARFHVKNT